MENKKSIRPFIGLALGLVIYLFIAVYTILPTFNLHYTGFLRIFIPFFVVLYIWEIRGRFKSSKPFVLLPMMPFIVIFLLILTAIPFILLVAIPISFFVEKKKGMLTGKPGASRFILLGIIIYTSIIPFIVSSPVMRSSSYRDLIGEIQVADDLNELYPPVSQDQIRIVDQDMALRLGEKTLGADPSIGSQAQLGDFNIQSVNGQLYWVAPLLHSGFFKWIENREGTTGYVMVSATDDSDVTLVQENGGKPVRIKYQPDALFAEDLHRHIYLSGFMTTGYTDFSFEINDEGKPFWVVTLFEKKIGFQGKDASGVVIVDCNSGEVESYSIDETPAWVDRIQPEDFIVNQLDDWGEYVHGIFNFSDKDKLTTTYGLSLVYGKDGRSFWNTGLTSVGADEGTVGFVLVDTRTKEAFWYKQAGATEFAAQLSAEGKVQEKRYSATQPVMYNLGGIPTYLMSLTDDGGLVKMFAAVSVADYTTVEVAESLPELLAIYQGELYASGASESTGSPVNEAWITLEAVVSRIAAEIEGGNTSYYMTVAEQSGKIFKARSRISKELSLTHPGDRVKLQFMEDDQKLIDLRDFDNRELP